MKTKLLTIFLFGLGCMAATAQNPGFLPPQDSLPPPVLRDSIPMEAGAGDSVVVTPPPLPSDPMRQIAISKDSLEAEINYESRDSMIYDLKNQRIYLYGGGKVDYTTINLEADLIEFDWTSNTVTAEGLADSLGRVTGKPKFSEGDQAFEAGKMRFNFRTRKGMLLDIGTVQNNLHVRGEKAKLISARDSTQSDIIYNKNAIFSTCDHPNPHFGIRSSKQKVIPNKLVIVGPSNLEVMGVPTPLWLPFGFFPASTGKSTGLLFPRDYEYSDNWGYGLRNIGWYFPISEYLDVQLTGDIYFKGSYRLRGVANYARRYKYSGNLRLEYHSLRNENNEGVYVRDPSMIFELAHNQDAKAHPSRTIGGNIAIQTNNALSRNYNDPTAALNTTLRSNFTYSEALPGKPISFSAGLNHSQNTQSREVTINFPQFNFQTQTLYPFKRKTGRAGKAEAWYEKLALTYRGEAKAQLITTDSTLFREESLDKIEFGARHKVSSNASFKLFKYFNINPRVNYTEVWFFKTDSRTFDPTLQITFDTITNPDGELVVVGTDTVFGQVLDTTLFGFKPLRKFDTGFSLDTKLFGTLLFKKGPLRGLRHIMTPTVGFSYVPDYTKAPFSYFRTVQQDTRDPDDLLEYSVFGPGLYAGERPSNNGLQMLMTYGISNIFEAKAFSKRDSTFKNFRLLKRFSIDGSYNFAAEEFKFSTIQVNAAASFFQNIVNVLMNASFDPYDVDAEGKRVNTLLWDSRKQLARFVSTRISVSSSLRVQQIKDLFQGDKKKGAEKPGALPQSDGLLDIFNQFGIRHSLVFTGNSNNGKDTIFVSAHTVDFNGTVPLTQKWKVIVGSFGYDFKNQRITYPSLAISRDLHCWDMGLSWQPSRQTYSFYLRVDQGSVFDFINIPYQKGNQDTIFSGGFQGF